MITQILSYEQFLNVGRLDAPYLLGLVEMPAFEVGQLRLQQLDDVCSFLSYGTIRQESKGQGSYYFAIEDSIRHARSKEQGPLPSPLPVLPQDIIIPLHSLTVYLGANLDKPIDSAVLLFQLHPGYSVRFFKHLFATRLFQQKLQAIKKYTIPIDFLEKVRTMQLTIPTPHVQRELAHIIVQAEVEADILKARAAARIKQSASTFEQQVAKTQLVLRT